MLSINLHTFQIEENSNKVWINSAQLFRIAFDPGCILCILPTSRGGEINCPCCPSRIFVFLLTCPWTSEKHLMSKCWKSKKHLLFPKKLHRSNSNFSNLQRWWGGGGTLSHYYVTILCCLPEVLTYVFATKFCRWWLTC